MKTIKLWANDTNPPVFCLVGPTGTGKSAIAQVITEWYDAQGLLVSLFCYSLSLIGPRVMQSQEVGLPHFQPR